MRSHIAAVSYTHLDVYKRQELYDLAWKYLKPLWYYKIAALYAQDFQNILDKMADDGLSQSMLEKERTLISKLYRTAIGWRVVDSNLASVLKVEGRKSPEREIFTDEQVTLILNQKNTPTGQMVIALLACGVRILSLIHICNIIVLMKYLRPNMN